LDKSVALSLIQSRSSDVVSCRAPSPTFMALWTVVGCAGTEAGSSPVRARRRIGSRRRGTTARRARGRPPETDGFDGESRPVRSPSSASAELSAATVPSTNAAAAMSLACGLGELGSGFADSASLINDPSS
jgi:hypothetical protein